MGQLLSGLRGRQSGELVFNACRSFWGDDKKNSGDGCALMSLNCTFKNGKNVYVRYILPYTFTHKSYLKHFRYNF